MVMEHIFSILLLLSILCVQKCVLDLATEDVKRPMNRCAAQGKGMQRNSFLWTLKEYPSVYLFGTIHRPYTSVWPMIPRNVKRAFKTSQNVYFEIDLTSPKYLLTIMKCQLLPNKQTLSTVLPRRIWKKLRRYLHYVRCQFPLWINKNQIKGGGNTEKMFKDMTRNWQRKRPIWMMLQLMSLNEDYVRTSGIPSLDIYLFRKSRKARKKIGSLESPREYCRINNVNSSQAILYLDKILTKYRLARVGKLRLPSSSELTYNYLCGNLRNFIFSLKHGHLNSSQTLQENEMNEFEESLKQELLINRNQKMAENIIKEIHSIKGNENKRMFFIVGAGHLIGNESVIDLLEARGFKTKHIPANDVLPRMHKLNDQKSMRKNHGKNIWKTSHKMLPTPSPTLVSSKDCKNITQESKAALFVRSSAGQAVVKTQKIRLFPILGLLIVSIID